MFKHQNFAMIVLRLNNHEMKSAYTQAEKQHLEIMTTHMYFPMLKGKDTFNQESHDAIVCTAQDLGIE
jgi:hypothetical protein